MAETNTFVQVPPDSTGAKIDHAGFTIGTEAVKRQRIQLSARTNVITASVTRPADTNTYASGDVVADSVGAPTKITFAGVAYEGQQSGLIVSATMASSANPALKGDFRIFLFDTSFVMEGDNVAWDPSDAEMETCLGFINFGAAPEVGGASGGTSNVIYQALGLNIPYKCTGALLDIYGVIVVRNAYVPISGEKFTIRLHVVPD